jgi:type II secretory pathway component GspD/PulD (secretin)
MNSASRIVGAILALTVVISPSFAQEKKLIELPKKIIPVPKPPPKEIVGEPFLKTYPVPGGNADALAKLLQDVFPAPKARIAALGKNQIAVWAEPQVHITIAQQQPLRSAELVQIPLANQDARQLAKTLNAMFGNAPFIEADAEANALRIRGSTEQVDEVRLAIQSLDKGSAHPGNVRIFNVENGSAATVADAISHLYKGRNPIIIGSPGAPSMKPDPAKKDIKGFLLPIYIVAVGPKLIITSDDKEALSTIVSLCRVLVNTDVARDFEVVRLRFAKAADVAKVIDEAFNGKQGVHKAVRVRVVADPDTNTLLLRATVLDTITIRNLVTRSLDVRAEDRKTEK